jgi:stage III sporulation protein AH
LFRGRRLIITVLLLTTVLLFFCLGLSYANRLHPDNLPVKGQISETDIQFQADLPDSSLSGEEYFVDYRLGREQFRQEVKSMLQVLLNSSDMNNRKSAQTKWLELSTEINQEGELENLLKIRGYQDVIADINKDSAFIIVLTQGLTPYEIFSIQDTVNRVAGICSERVTIEVKN